MSDSLTPIQSKFLLAMAASAGNHTSGPHIGRKVREKILEKVAHVPAWELIWGPGVYQHTLLGTPTNTLFCAYNSEEKAYYLGVAGTNPASIYDWFAEDLGVKQMDAWPYGSPPSGVQIANGTLTGLHKLQSLIPQKDIAGDGMTIVEFLQKDIPQRPDAKLMITGGHSLGGALSPTLALWLKDTQHDWDPAGQIQQVQNYAYAGPTAGNKQFADYSNQRLDLIERVFNSKDIVPHAWYIPDLESIKAMYLLPDGGGINSKVIDKKIDKYVSQLKDFGYTQIGMNPMQLEGSVNTSLITSKNEFIDFVKQVIFQHIKAYYILLGVESIGLAEAHSLEPTDQELKQVEKLMKANVA